MVIVSCQPNKNEYIEITTGFSMNPNEPRIGIIIYSNDSVYICKEIISLDNSQLPIFKYYAGKEKIDFKAYKNAINILFQDSIIPHLSEDARVKKLDYYLAGKHQERYFTQFQLSENQNQFLDKMHQLAIKNRFVEIPYHQFTRDLLDYRLPDTPPPPK